MYNGGLDMEEIRPACWPIPWPVMTKAASITSVKADEKFVWLSDGKLKDTASPKRKNRKHIQVIKKGAVEAPEPLTNEAVKRIIKQYLRKEL